MSTIDLSSITKGIADVLAAEEPVLRNLDETVITERRNKQNRSIKQLLGHLIDSASNNHQRMVRLQYNENLSFPDYTQDNDRWIALQDYQHADWNNLIGLWKFYNLHIIQVMRSVDQTKLSNYWHDFEGNKVTLQQMIEGYLWHLNLHINDIHELIEE